MKQTFPWALKASVSGVMHKVWKRWEGLMLCSAWIHSAHTAHTSCSDRQLSLRDRMSARDTFSCRRQTSRFQTRAHSNGITTLKNHFDHTKNKVDVCREQTSGHFLHEGKTQIVWIAMAAHDHTTTHTLLVPRNDARHPHEHTHHHLWSIITEEPNLLCGTQQTQRVHAASCGRSITPSSVHLTQNLAFPSLLASTEGWRYVRIDIIVRHKESTVNPCASISITNKQQKYFIFSSILSSVCHSLKHLCQLAGQRAAGVPEQIYSGWSQLQSRKRHLKQPHWPRK